ncbi:MAG: pilus assembly protein PilB [Actinobacteria bacterium]|nr:pilus assembly protein PilB [Actinomycetota bacterium]MSY71369.1 pilus assembly protein PilB [Actinomycetota bacterium]
MKLRKVSVAESIIDLPRARLVPDPREVPMDVGRLGALIGGAPEQQARVEMVLSNYLKRGGALGRMLVEEAGVAERTFADTVSRQLVMPLSDLRSDRPTADALAWVKGADAHRLGLLPLRFSTDVLTVAVCDPFDSEMVYFLESLPVIEVHLKITTASELRSGINHAYPALDEVNKYLVDFARSDAAVVGSQVETISASAFGTDEAPVIQVVNKIVTQALRDRASDVHIEPMDDRVRVRYRIDGALREVLSLPTEIGPALVSRIKIMADMNIVERRRPQDGQFQVTVDARDLDVRVAITPTIWGEKTVLRLLDKSRSLYRLSELGMPADSNAIYSRMVRSPFGMLIVSGPTGSGKTTTLYATLNEINREDINVMTIEDPVEYVFPSVNQIQINDQAGITFATGLKSMLRQDPDVILVGEVRDVETARIAVQSALTGHFVLSSVHATDSVSALIRLLDMGIESFLIAASVMGVVAQRLVRRICSSCAIEYTPSVADLAVFRSVIESDKSRFVRGAGCNVCSNTGYYGRVGVYEVLSITEEIRQLVVAGASPRELRDCAISQGLRTLRHEAGRMVENDITTIDEVIRNVYVSEGML